MPQYCQVDFWWESLYRSNISAIATSRRCQDSNTANSNFYENPCTGAAICYNDAQTAILPTKDFSENPCTRVRIQAATMSKEQYCQLDIWWESLDENNNLPSFSKMCTRAEARILSTQNVMRILRREWEFVMDLCCDAARAPCKSSLWFKYI